MNNTLKLTYFNITGRAEPIRLALHIAGIKFEDERIPFEQFGKLKAEGKFKFGQLPILTVNGSEYAQSFAIIKYVGKITGMYPKDELEQLLIDQEICSIYEIRDKLVANKNNPDIEYQTRERKILAGQFLPQWFGYLNKELEKSESGYFLKNLSVADLELYNIIHWIKLDDLKGIPADITVQYSALERLFSQIHNMPQVQQWNKDVNNW